MKENNKCFIKLDNGNYEEITYKELLERRKTLKEYKDKKFIKVDKFLLEVTKDEYKQFDSDKKREKYTRRYKDTFKTISLDKVYADKYTLKDVIPDSNNDMEDKLQSKIDIEKIQKALTMLNNEEYKLIKALFFEKKTIRKYAKQLDVHFKTIQTRKRCVFKKLKKIIKNL